MKIEYLDRFNMECKLADKFTVSAFTARSRLTAKYSWAIPTKEAILEISKYSPIVEIGAGTGYWASLIAQTGAKIICFDAYANGNNPYRHKVKWYPVSEGNESVLEKFSSKMTLFLCWPPYDDPMASNCLNNFKGKYLIYIGESSYGCTGDGKFHEMLYEKWDLVKTIGIPQWMGIHDGISIYKRRNLNANNQS